jgi:hypothetical protein
MKKTPAIIAWVALMVIVFIAGETYATEAEVDRAIVFLLEEGIPKHGIKPFKYHPLYKDDKKRAALARAIFTAAEKHDVPQMLLLTIAFREGSLVGGVGDIGEVSTFQVIPRNQRAIRRGRFPWTDYKEPECDLKTLEGAALCSAALMRIDYLKCQDWGGALVLYATGTSCKADTKRRRFIRRDRLGIMEVLDGLKNR